VRVSTMVMGSYPEVAIFAILLGPSLVQSDR